jgi:hypothetical protein
LKGNGVGSRGDRGRGSQRRGHSAFHANIFLGVYAVGRLRWGEYFKRRSKKRGKE